MCLHTEVRKDKFWGYLPNSAIRQSLAISVVLIGYTFLQEKRFLYFTFWVVLGTLVHKSAIIVLFLIPMFYFLNAKKFYKYSFILFGLGLVFSSQMAMLFMNQNEIYDGYLSGGYYVRANSSKPIMVILLILCLYVIGWLGLSKNTKNDDDKLKYFGASLVLSLLPLIWVNPSLIRVIGYFSAFMGIVVGESFNKIRYGSLIRKGVIVVFLYQSLSNIDSYKFMWEYMELHERYGQIIKQPVHDQIKEHNCIYLIKKT